MGAAQYNENLPFGHNPFVNIPSDVDRAPLRLVYLDLVSVVKLMRLLPKIILPLWPTISGALDELSFTWGNAESVTLQLLLFILQLSLLVLLPVVNTVLFFAPAISHILFYGVFRIVTSLICWPLNGSKRAECLVGLPEDYKPVNDETELWFFINGIATGQTWHQSNLSLLANIFRREIVGIHNPTKGLIFDLIECLIQRDLDYKTRDIRQGHIQIRAALSSPRTRKVVLILHSQGGIEGSAILDCLLADLSTDIVSKLEIFTFGNAARRFSNPLLGSSHRTSKEVDLVNGRGFNGRGDRVIRHIEHYANSEDFVSNIGVLAFTSPRAQPYADGNPFFGHVFTRDGSGHLLNMHYLDKMFPFVNGKVDDEGNEFMNSFITKQTLAKHMVNGHESLRIKDVSRLWKYRNGMCPED